MMMAQRRILILLVIAAVLASCASEQPKTTPPAQTDGQTTQTAETGQATQAVETGTQTPSGGQQASTAFVASQDLYKKTFSEVQEVIAALTAIIAKADYDGWLTYLTADYIATTGSPANLDKASKSAILQKNGIVLKTLKDYFLNVVVRSHHQASLDDIQFVDATHVKAISMIQGTPVILYYLVHEQGRWKVGLQQADTN
jgi:hypothetical protein